MLMNIFIIWLLISVFFGSREANSFFRFMIGLSVGLWALKMIIGFGIGLLPLILLIVLISRTLVPFIKGFISSFRDRR